MTNRSTRNVGLCNLPHGDGRLDPSLDTLILTKILERKAVHDRAEHAHVIGTGAIHAAFGELRPAEVVAATNDDCDFRTTCDHICDLSGNSLDNIWIYAQATAPGECFTREFKKDPTETALGNTRPQVNRSIKGRLNHGLGCSC